MLVQLLEILLFSAVSAFPNDRNDVVYPSMETLRSGIKRIKFRALEQDIDLRLEPAGDVIADDFGIIHGAGYKIDRSMDVQNLKRKLYRDPKMGAALHIDEDGPLTINGIINTELRIKPDTLKKKSKNGIIAHHVIEVSRDENLHPDFRTISTDLKISSFDYEVRKLGENDCLKVEYLFVTESNFTAIFNETDSMEIYLANAMNRVQTIMDSLDLGLKVAIIGIIKLTKENESSLAPYIPQSPKGMDAKKLLRDFRYFYCRSKDYDKIFARPDMVMLITTRPLGEFESDGTFNPRILGLAYPGTLCNKCMKYGLVRDIRNQYGGADTIAHESGHLLGCYHDGEMNSGGCGAAKCPASLGHFMGSRNKENGTKFSSCCKNCVRYKLKFPVNRCIVEKCDEMN